MNNQTIVSQDEAVSEMQQQMMRDDKHKVHIYNEVLDKQPNFKPTKGSKFLMGKLFCCLKKWDFKSFMKLCSLFGCLKFSIYNFPDNFHFPKTNVHQL